MEGNSLLNRQWFPFSDDNYPNDLKIVGIDPGSYTLGVSILTVSSLLRLLSIEAYTLRLEHHLETYADRDNFNRKYEVLEHLLYERLLKISPIAIGIESPFIQTARANAVRPLLLTNNAIHRAIHRANNDSFIGNIPPRTIKKFLLVEDITSKESVTKALLKNEDVIRCLSKDEIMAFDEHSIDAIGAGMFMLHTLDRWSCNNDLK